MSASQAKKRKYADTYNKIQAAVNATDEKSAHFHTQIVQRVPMDLKLQRDAIVLASRNLKTWIDNLQTILADGNTAAGEIYHDVNTNYTDDNGNFNIALVENAPNHFDEAVKQLAAICVCYTKLVRCLSLAALDNNKVRREQPKNNIPFFGAAPIPFGSN